MVVDLWMKFQPEGESLMVWVQVDKIAIWKLSVRRDTGTVKLVRNL